jgi:hypothetical protein
MPLSTHPRRLLIILLVPVIVCVGYVAVAASGPHWFEIVAPLFLIALHAPATLAVIKGKTVSLPWYYVTVEADSLPRTKVMAILGLMAPPYSIAFTSLAKHLSLG